MLTQKDLLVFGLERVHLVAFLLGGEVVGLQDDADTLPVNQFFAQFLLAALAQVVDVHGPRPVADLAEVFKHELYEEVRRKTVVLLQGIGTHGIFASQEVVLLANKCGVELDAAKHFVLEDPSVFETEVDIP